MWHYKVTDKIDNQVILDSSQREEFKGFGSEGIAHLQGLSAKIENKLPDYCIVETFYII